MSSSPEEAVGPFSSWVNLKTTYGAVGNGTTDDTTAIQNALNDLSNQYPTATHAPVLYVPAGTYVINSPLTLSVSLGVSIVGDGSSTTIWKCGSSFSGGGTLLTVSSIAYSRVNQITFDGNSLAGILIDQSVPGSGSPNPFDTGNEYSDLVLKNATQSPQIGIRAGNSGHGASEGSVLRCSFDNMTYGVMTMNFNALDWWIWYANVTNTFTVGSNNLVGTGSAGAFHVYNSVTESVLGYIKNTGVFNFRDNFCYPATDQSYSVWQVTNADNGAVTRSQSNTIYVDTIHSNDPSNLGQSWNHGNLGPLVMTDTIFISPSGQLAPAITMFDNVAPDAIFVGDQFNTTGPGGAGNYTVTPTGRVISYGEIDTYALTPTPPTLPGTPTNYGRTVFDVAAGASTATIQAAIASAFLLNGSAPVVHLAYGDYTLSAPLVIPSCDLQLVGDGFGQGGTNINANGNFPAITLQGPSHVQLREFFLNASGGVAIAVQNADQVGAQIYMQQPQMTRGTLANIFVDGLDNALVEMHNAGFNETAVSPAVTGVGLLVKGGPLAAAGNPQGGKTNVFAAAAGANYLSFQATNGADLIVRDCWYEGTGNSTLAIVSDNSNFTWEGGQFAVPVDGSNGPAVLLQSHSGLCTVLCGALTSYVSADSGSSGNIWVAGINFQGTYAPNGPNATPNQYATVNSGSGTAFFNNNRIAPGGGPSVQLTDSSSPSSTFVTAMLARSRAAHPIATFGGITGTVTDVRIYRISVDEATYGIHITGGAAGVPLFGAIQVAAFLRANARGTTSIAGRAKSNSRAQGFLSTVAPLTALSGIGKVLVAAKAAATIKMPIMAHAVVMNTGIIGAVIAAKLRALAMVTTAEKSTIACKSSLLGSARASAKANGSQTGITSLSGRSSAKSKIKGLFSSIVSLTTILGTTKSSVSARASATVTMPMTAHTTSTVTVKASGNGTASLFSMSKVAFVGRGATTFAPLLMFARAVISSTGKAVGSASGMISLIGRTAIISQIFTHLTAFQEAFEPVPERTLQAMRRRLLTRPKSIAR